jgi:hypothetical protein
VATSFSIVWWSLRSTKKPGTSTEESRASWTMAKLPGQLYITRLVGELRFLGLNRGVLGVILGRWGIWRRPRQSTLRGVRGLPRGSIGLPSLSQDFTEINSSSFQIASSRSCPFLYHWVCRPSLLPSLWLPSIQFCPFLYTDHLSLIAAC